MKQLQFPLHYEQCTRCQSFQSCPLGERLAREDARLKDFLQKVLDIQHDL